MFIIEQSLHAQKGVQEDKDWGRTVWTACRKCSLRKEAPASTSWVHRRAPTRKGLWRSRLLSARNCFATLWPYFCHCWAVWPRAGDTCPGAWSWSFSWLSCTNKSKSATVPGWAFEICKDGLENALDPSQILEEQLEPPEISQREK